MNAIYISSYSTASATFASCKSTNAIQVKWIPSYSPPFSRERCRGDERRRRPFPSLLFSLRARGFESRVDRKPRAFPRTEDRLSLFGFRVSKAPDLDAEKGKLCRDCRHSLVVHVLQERELYTSRFKETTVARGILSGEFRAEALVVASLCFTAIITRTLLDAAGDYHWGLSSALGVYSRSFQRESVSSVSTVDAATETDIGKVNREGPRREIGRAHV